MEKADSQADGQASIRSPLGYSIFLNRIAALELLVAPDTTLREVVSKNESRHGF